MKRFFIVCLLIITSSLPTAWAYQQGECCPDEGPFDCLSSIFTRFDVYGEALYWRPNYDGVQYATVDPGAGISSRPEFVEPDNSWGYRYGARIGIACDYYFEANYTFYTQSNRASIRAPGQILPIFSPFVTDLFDEGKADIHSRYRTVDLVAGFQWLDCGLVQSHLFAGARYFRIREKENFVYTDGTGPTSLAPASQKYGIDGWGARLGIDYLVNPLRSCWLEPFGIEGHFAVMAGFGDRVNKVKSLGNAGIFPQGDLLFPERFVTVLATDFRLGVQYSVDLWCLELTGKFGYELNYYFNARKRIDSTNTIGFAPRSTSGLGYGGPYIGLNAAF